MKSAIWIQRKSPADHSVIIFNENVTYDNDAEYKKEFTRFSNLMKLYKVKQLSESCSVGSGLFGLTFSGLFEELDNRGRHVPYTFYSTGGNIEQIKSKLLVYSQRQGYSIPKNDMAVLDLGFNTILKKRLLAYTIMLVIIILSLILIF